MYKFSERYPDKADGVSIIDVKLDTADTDTPKRGRPRLIKTKRAAKDKTYRNVSARLEVLNPCCIYDFVTEKKYCGHLMFKVNGWWIAPIPFEAVFKKIPSTSGLWEMQCYHPDNGLLMFSKYNIKRPNYFINNNFIESY